MSFAAEFDSLPLAALVKRSLDTSTAEVRESLGKPRPGLEDFAHFISPAGTELLVVAIPALSPSPADLVDEFNPLPIEAKPRLMRHSSMPLRPKIAVGNAAGPLTVRSGGVRAAPARRGQTDSPKNMPRSMLHLDDDSQTANSEMDADASTIFGRLGGLFSRKGKGN